VFKSYVQGEWEMAAEHIERCLELWDTDGPTKALQYYMQFYRFMAPASWNGFRDIDEEIDMDKINMEQNYDGEEEEAEEQPQKSKRDATESVKAKK
jgi:hypothetical protein